MLQLDGQAWATGASGVSFGRDRGERGTLLVDISVGGQLTTVFLDTGAELSVASPQHVPRFADCGWPVGNAALDTRLGMHRGEIYRLPVCLEADVGVPLEFEANFLVAETWTGPMTVGFYNALERIRFAIDPGGPSRDPMIYFGQL